MCPNKSQRRHTQGFGRGGWRICTTNKQQEDWRSGSKKRLCVSEDVLLPNFRALPDDGRAGAEEKADVVVLLIFQHNCTCVYGAVCVCEMVCRLGWSEFGLVGCWWSILYLHWYYRLPRNWEMDISLGKTGRHQPMQSNRNDVLLVAMMLLQSAIISSARHRHSSPCSPQLNSNHSRQTVPRGQFSRGLHPNPSSRPSPRLRAGVPAVQTRTSCFLTDKFDTYLFSCVLPSPRKRQWSKPAP